MEESTEDRREEDCLRRHRPRMGDNFDDADGRGLDPSGSNDVVPL